MVSADRNDLGNGAPGMVESGDWNIQLPRPEGRGFKS
jgi:hypothetical protein